MAAETQDTGSIVPGPEHQVSARRQRMRSIAIALTLAFLVAAFYAATIVRLGGNVLNRSL